MSEQVPKGVDALTRAVAGGGVRGLQGRLYAAVDALAPTSVLAQGHSRQFRYIVLVHMVLVLCCAFCEGVTYLAAGEFVIPFSVPLSALSLVVYVAALRAEVPVRVATHGVLLFFYLFIAILCGGTGGVSSPAVGHFAIVASAAVALLDRRAGWAWALLCFVTVYSYLVIPPEVFESVVGRAMREKVWAQAMVGSQGFLYVTMLVAYLDQNREAESDALSQALISSQAMNVHLEKTRTEAESAREAAEAAGRAREAFLATMSHELRTPLNGAMGTLALLDDDRLDEDQRRLMAVARRSGDNLVGLVNDILDLTKFSSGDVALEAEQVSMRRLVDDVAVMFASRARKHGVDLQVSLDANVPAMVVGDGARLQQVVGNLVGNAVKFSPRGRVDLTVDVVNDRLQIVVADNGIGMSDALVAQLFQPFLQADSSMTRRYGGSGLGLALAMRLVSAMEGDITVVSAEGVGSTFTVDLPLVVADVEPSAPLLSRSVSEDAVVPPGLHVLLAEDNPVNVLVARRLLASLGCRVSVVGDGEAAVREALAINPDVVLMDVQMPVMDGLQATSEIRKAEAGGAQHRWVVGLSADAMLHEQRAGLAAGMDDYLTKPIEVPKLKKVLAAVAEGRSRRQRLAAPSVGSLAGHAVRPAGAT